MTVPVGVLRAVIRVDAETDEVDTTGTLWVDLPDDLLIEEDVVLYTLDCHRLVGMLEAARAGESDEAILLALDAAALDTPPDDWSDE